MGINFLISTNAAASNSEAIPMARVVVSRGDNLWNLVQEYNPEYKGDIREAIDQVQKINGIQGANIQPGDVLMIPVHKAKAPTRPIPLTSDNIYYVK